MPRSLVRLACCLLLLTLAAACGTGGSSRPYVVGVWPSPADGIDGPLPYVRIDYNEPVGLLNPADYTLSVDGAGFGSFVTQYADDPDSVYILPAGRDAFPANASIAGTLIQGLVVNTARRYAAEIATFTVQSGPEATLPVGEAGAVSLVDCLTGATDEAVPAPGAHDPVAVRSTTRGSTRRIWVQFADEGGVGTALAWFEPGDVAMTPVALTTTGASSAPRGALVVGPRARTVYAAFRDEGTGTVRVHAIDTATGAETDVLDLASQPADPTAVPTGLALASGPSPSELHVGTADAGGARVARIALAGFTEIDQDTQTPGTQGIALPGAGGPVVAIDTRSLVAVDGGSDVAVAPAGSTATLLAGTTLGSTTAVARSPDRTLVLQGLTGFAGLEMLQARTQGPGYDDPTAVEVSDDVGGVSQGATAVRGIVWVTGGTEFLAVLDSAAGSLLTVWSYANGPTYEQLDLDDGTAGVQALPLAAAVLVVGSNHGPYAD